MKRPAYSLKLPAALKAAAARLAQDAGVSLNHWITDAVAHRVGAADTAAAFFTRRASICDGPPGHRLRAVLAKVPDLPPDPWDRLP